MVSSMMAAADQGKSSSDSRQGYQVECEVPNGIVVSNAVPNGIVVSNAPSTAACHATMNSL